MTQVTRAALTLLGIFAFALCRVPHAQASTSSEMVDVLIVGGGIAGSNTAYRLSKAGITFKVLELLPRLGGRARTASYPGGGVAEVGLEEFWEANPALEIMRELGMKLEKSATSFSSFIHAGKVYPFTQDTNVEFLKSVLSPEELKKYQTWDRRVAETYARMKSKGLDKALLKLKDVSFADWVKRKEFGLSKKTLEFIRMESEPEYATSWERISALDGMDEWHIFAGKGSGSFHVVDGNQTVAEVIAKKLGSEHFLLNHQVTNLNSREDHVEVIATHLATNEQKIIKARYVVSTVPLFRLNEIQFTPPLSAKRQQAIQTQTWGAYFTAHVFVDPAAERFWKFNDGEAFPILTDSPVGVIYSGHDSRPDATEKPYKVLNILVTGDHAETFNSRLISFDQVGEEIRAGFEKLWPGFGKHIQRMTFYRYHPRAVASWPVGRSRFDELSQLMRTPEGRIYFAGDFTEGTHSDDAARSAIRVTEQITRRHKSGKSAKQAAAR